MAIIKLTARFAHADSGKPLTGEGLTVRFCDRDTVKDDVLGESLLSPDGRAEIVTTTGSFHSGLAFGERRPDLYCVVCDHGKPVFRTPVAWDTKVAERSKTTGQTMLTHDLGTFKYTRGAGFEEAPQGGFGIKPVI
ncbi:MAG TPA: hypothetical protein VHN77_10120 [Phycisphaerales bacterium]|nr:hypothetical protein [Phycisphaerales bacterium]